MEEVLLSNPKLISFDQKCFRTDDNQVDDPPTLRDLDPQPPGEKVTVERRKRRLQGGPSRQGRVGLHPDH